MKIGILTFHRAYNYGAALQAFALQCTLKKLKIESEIVDYGTVGEGTRFPQVTFSPKSFFRFIRCLVLTLGIEDLRRKRYLQFREKFLTMSPCRYLDAEALQSAGYTCYIVGSDQVWNPVLAQGHTAYLLGFAQQWVRKIAYAPSLGVTCLTKEMKTLYQQKLAQFDFLSVRENSGQQLISELTGKTCPVLLDPTFLLEADDYDCISKSVGIRSRYVCCYRVGAAPEMVELARRVGEKLRIRVVLLSSGRQANWLGAKDYHAAGPSEFLGIIRKASFIITNSFHGMAFAIIYRCSFFVCRNGTDGDSRMETVLEKFGLKSRLISTSDWKSKELLAFDTDFSCCEKQLFKERQKSIAFLQNSLKERG